LSLLAEHSTDGAIHFVCSDWRHLDEMLTSGCRIYRELKNLVVWNKTNAGMGSFYRSQHELIFVWKHGRGKHINNIELGKHGRHRSNVWTYAGSNTFGSDRLEELAHPTVKPVALVADAIRDCSRRGDLVLDSFGGSGILECRRPLCVPKTSSDDDFGFNRRIPCSRTRIPCSAEIIPCSVA
jgi:hypothetical protein